MCHGGNTPSIDEVGEGHRLRTHRASLQMRPWSRSFTYLIRTTCENICKNTGYLIEAEGASKIASSRPPKKSSKMPMFNRLEEALGHPPVRNSLIPTSFQPKQTQVESSHQNPATAPAVQTEAVHSKRVQPMKIPEAIEEEPTAVQESESSASDGSASKSKST